MKPYRKLVTGSGVATRMTLYRGVDHLLLVEGSVYEEYRRFFYKEIRAAIWVPNLAYTWFVGGFGFLFVAISVRIRTWGVTGPAMFFMAVGVLIWLRLAYVLFRGGYCKFYLHTAAQDTRIRGVSVVSKAKKIVRLIDSMNPPASETPFDTTP